ncbi:MAG: CDP-alcohol phosphatidyltransferase family protein [Terriglobia bacterium]
MTQRVFTLANQLTLLRMALIPFFAVALLSEHNGWAMGLLLAAGASDLLDGMLARRLQQRTSVGAYLDPIADKLLLSTAFIVLAIRGQVPWEVSIIVLGRDVLILAIGLVIIVGAGFRPFPPSVYGKACTTAQVVTVFLVVLTLLAPYRLLLSVKAGLLWLTVALTVVSGVHYAYRTGKVLPAAPSKP